jgi:hypothetical protein
MQRHEVINGLLSLFPAPTYLEVGVDAGVTFFAIEAPVKVAVDPHFKFPLPEPGSLPGDVTFFPLESDRYFAGGIDRKFDVAFLDGLHSFEQILKDFINAVDVRSPGGIIVIDDVIPSSYHAALPTLDLNVQFRTRLGISDGSWMGDVYRIVPFIDTFYPQFSYATVLENHGQMVLWPKQRSLEDRQQRTVEEIIRLDYAHAILENPFRIMPFAEIVSLIKASRGVG